MKELKKKLIKDWGKKCKNFSALCAVCLVWRAFETLESLYSMKDHITNWKKINEENNNI